MSAAEWQVLHLRPRSEKKVAELCRLNRVPHYLPLRRATRVYQRRRVTFESPLFPGYIFVAMDAPSRLLLLKSNHVVRVLTPPRQMVLLRQLVQVRRALRADPELSSVRPLVRGARVRILAGPCQGVEGIVDRLKGSPGRVRVVLNVELIGQAVAVEADANV
ncbi:MAG: transcription termination/antitermination NusG family protein, partial [Kiritimatiellae bacterium]|nr:transcription termination/antitermination NusG family protein [Kiritimatiellia bacterium]